MAPTLQGLGFCGGATSHSLGRPSGGHPATKSHNSTIPSHPCLNTLALSSFSLLISSYILEGCKHQINRYVMTLASPHIRHLIRLSKPWVRWRSSIHAPRSGRFSIITSPSTTKVCHSALAYRTTHLHSSASGARLRQIQWLQGTFGGQTSPCRVDGGLRRCSDPRLGRAYLLARGCRFHVGVPRPLCI